MFSHPDFAYKYVPILSISPAEMTALEKTYEEDKDKILPMFPLKGWVGSHNLQNSLDRIHKSIQDRNWIADIDKNFLIGKEKGESGLYERNVFNEIEKLLDERDGYKNWCDFIGSLENAIPVLQLEKEEQLTKQIEYFKNIDRGMVLKLDTNHLESDSYLDYLEKIHESSINDVLIVLDLGQITKEVVKEDVIEKFGTYIRIINNVLPDSLISTSASSFPPGFSPYTKGKNSIYERMLFNKVTNISEHNHDKFIYSDRGGARIEKNGGGSGTPAPRVDYALKNEWAFVRRAKVLDVPQKDDKQYRTSLYKDAAQAVLDSDYWDENLKIWGTQQIELTALGDSYGIDNAGKSTSVRINIHIYQQLHYEDTEIVDFEEDWED
ncbi:MAG: hypothetical protein RI556_02305 [Hydrogenovibrio sp.]|uniref:beta family protein n=1 Tax=Hydrogenovibrio sp. TaxID=2065821 RepID=UPI00287010C9|nr:hypothetical protein [Hydrogenovibrio sp.]MDR9497982.1 hypothetical protein [Hydrogenovibrio sp.]